MRKVKHFTGYGTVMMGRVKDSSCTLHVRVEGNHECGIEKDDEWLLYCWIVRRFDKNVPNYHDWYLSHPVINIYSGIKGDTDTCDYCFTY